MDKSNKIPRIIRIIEVDGFKIYCAFNNGEYRIIDFDQLFKSWNIKKSDPEFDLTRTEVFKKVKIVNGTLSWPEISKKIELSNGMTFDAPYEIDPIVLFENSESDILRNRRYEIGQIIRTARKKAGLTQEELAKKSGTTKNYISRIENNKSDIELRTLRKIIEIGLNKKLQIQIN